MKILINIEPLTSLDVAFNASSVILQAPMKEKVHIALNKIFSSNITFLRSLSKIMSMEYIGGPADEYDEVKMLMVAVTDFKITDGMKVVSYDTAFSGYLLNAYMVLNNLRDHYGNLVVMERIYNDLILLEV